MADITHLDADKGSDVVYYQRVVIQNFIKLLEDVRASFVDLAARHDAWTAELEVEAQRAPGSEAERLQRVRRFLHWRDEFEEELSDIDGSVDHLSVQAGRRVPGSSCATRSPTMRRGRRGPPWDEEGTSKAAIR